MNIKTKTERDLFERQLTVIKHAFTSDSILLGDLNLDYNKRFDVNYQRRYLFDLFEEKLGGLNLLQLVSFDTWSRLVGLALRSSLLDHIYVKNVDIIRDIIHDKPCFGDHELIVAHCRIVRPEKKMLQRRDWRSYTKVRLCENLGLVDWSNNATTVQDAWNDLETKLIAVVDALAPISVFNGDRVANKPCPIIKRKLNLRNRLLKLLKRRPTLELRNRIRNLNFEIRNHFYSKKRDDVRRQIIPGNSKSLWNAVNMSKDNAIYPLPNLMTLGGVPVSEQERSGCFASFFEEKSSHSH